MVNPHHHKDTLFTYIQVAVHQESGSSFTKLLLSFLSQVLNFVELHAASARSFLQLEFQSTPPPGLWSSANLRGHSNPPPSLLMKILWGISPCYWLLWNTTCKLATCNCIFKLWTVDTTLWPQRTRQFFTQTSLTWWKLYVFHLKKLGNSCTVLLNRHVQSNQQFNFDWWLSEDENCWKP